MQPESMNNHDNTTTATTNNVNETVLNPEHDNTNNSSKILSIVIKDLKVLYSAYMPFLNSGGLFIPTKKSFNPGDKLPLMITLIDENNKFSVDSKVVWITPSSANNRVPGIGVEFSGAQAAALSKKIDELLATYSSTECTNTM